MSLRIACYSYLYLGIRLAVDCSEPETLKNSAVKDKLLRSVVCIFILVIPASLLAQKTYVQYKIEDGLSSNSLYALEFDDRGFLWIGTEAGICRYNGQDFQIISQKGIPNVDALDIYKDSNNALWFNMLDGNFCRYENGTLLPPDSLVEFQNMGSYFWEDILEKDGNFYIVNSNRDVYTFKKNHEGRTLFEDHKRTIADRIKGLHINKDTDEMWVFRSKQRYLLDSQLSATQQDTIEIHQLESPISKFHCRIDGDLLYTSRHGIELLEGNQSRLVIPAKSLGLKRTYTRLKVIGRDAIILTTDDGVFIAKDIKNFKGELIQLFPGKMLTDLVYDGAGNMWISSLNEGLFKIFPPETHWLTEGKTSAANEIYSVASNENGDIFFGDGVGNLYCTDSSLRIKSKLETPYRGHSRARMKEIICLNDSINLVASDQGLLIWNHKKNTGDWKGKKSSIKKLIQVNDSLAYVQSSAGLSSFNLFTYKSKSLKHKNGIALCSKSSNTLYLGGNQGLSEFRLDSLNEEEIHGIPKVRIHDLAINKKEQLAICTANDGLFLYTENSNKKFNEKDGLAGDNCQDIFWETDEILWYSTLSGINKIYFNSDLSIKASYSYTKHNTLPSEAVRDAMKIGEQMYVATAKGIAVFIDKLEAQRKQEVYLEKIQVNDKIVSNEQNNFSEKDNNLKFHWNSPNFHEKVAYKFRLLGHNEEWQLTNKRAAAFYQLPFGEYIFELIIAGKEEGLISHRFTINQSVWRKSWFRLLLFLAPVFVIFSFMYWRRELNKRNAVLKLEHAEALSTALRAQMNPHFLFNSLNSIQSFIFEKEERVANDYLVKYSRLMRLVLENSSKPSVSLEEELNCLEDYVKLEDLRLEHELHYQVIIDKDLLIKDTLVPTFLLQPIIENAIWHGIQPKGKDGTLRLQVNKRDQTLQYIIRDDGVGLDYWENKVKKHQNSHGLKIIKQRLYLIQKISKVKTKFEIKSIKTIKDHSKTLNSFTNSGTEVIIEIPLLLKSH